MILKALVLIGLVGCSSSGGGVGTVDAAVIGVGVDAPSESVTPVVINFDNLADGDPITNQYAVHATFSAAVGDEVDAMAQDGFGESPPNFACTNGCGGDYYIDFTKPVEHLMWNAIGVNDTGSVAMQKIYLDGALAATIALTGEGDLSVPVKVDLSTYRHVTRLEITQIIDFGGFGIDDIAFDVP